VFSKMKGTTNDRGVAAGPIDPTHLNLPVGRSSRFQFQPMKRDGTISGTNYATPAASVIVGYYNRHPRIPYCRMTALTMDNYSAFQQAHPFIRAVDRAFREGVPSRYAAQEAMTRQTSPNFYIRDTVFTTITVNRDWQTALHRDSGDYAQGFGVLTVLQGGSYDGGYLVFPKYRVAVDMRTGGVLLTDVHEFHGNTAIVGVPGEYLRLSLVLYFRTRMRECGSAAEELERAKRLPVL
jgi:2-oxoglutarate-Fe(II)-dependent dioxygenase family protein